jgi:hypothetical protein
MAGLWKPNILRGVAISIKGVENSPFGKSAQTSPFTNLPAKKSIVQ